MSTTVSYKGNVLTTVNNQTKVLNTAGKWLEGDITLVDSTAGGAISISDIPNSTGTTGAIIGIVPSYGTKTISQNGTYSASADGYDGFSSVTVNVSGGGGTPSQTQHSIYFEFSDETNTTITAYWDGTFISDAVRATSPSTYNNKTVTLAQLDGVTWYSSSQETFETLFDGSKDANADTPYNYFWFDTLSDVYPTVGSVWRVTIDGAIYHCVAYTLSTSFGNLVCFGNPKYTDNGTDDGTSAPFNFYNAGWGALVADTEVSQGSHSVKIERMVTV